MVLWDVRAKKRRGVMPWSGPSSRLLAVRGACVVFDSGGVTRLSETTTPLASFASALAESDRGVMIAGRAHVVELDDAGKELASVPCDIGVTAIGELPDRVVIGYDDGAVDIVDRAGGKLSLLDMPSSAVQRLLPGPMSTLVVGFESGVVGMWDTSNGRLLLRRKLHGPIAFLASHGEKLVMVSELGQVRVEDLAVLHRDWCTVLRDVWQQVPVVWEDGRLVERSVAPGDCP